MSDQSVTQYQTEIPSDAKTVITNEGWTLSYAVETKPPFAINAWNVTNPYPTGEPFWHQPHDLAGEDWLDAISAQSFADQWVEDNFVNPQPVTPPSQPSAQHVAAAQTILEAAGYVITPPAN